MAMEMASDNILGFREELLAKVRENRCGCYSCSSRRSASSVIDCILYEHTAVAA